MAEAIKLRVIWQGELAEMRILMPHPMETGQRKDPETGKPLPAHFIESFSVTANGQELVRGQLNTAIARNPLFSFYARGLKAGDRLAVLWTDNKGEKRRDPFIVPAN
ncbi:MAG TPA: thiosulfate oxidation carrier complex protein SoxZ [Accumulibacter sp.]|jgi:sulfur-oxidizing protein SoxZ|nr:thiosulfate oxidation carrier complex protein SoxZ [Accumulibacter sp.]